MNNLILYLLGLTAPIIAIILIVLGIVFISKYRKKNKKKRQLEWFNEQKKEDNLS